MRRFYFLAMILLFLDVAVFPYSCNNRKNPYSTKRFQDGIYLLFSTTVSNGFVSINGEDCLQYKEITVDNEELKEEDLQEFLLDYYNKKGFVISHYSYEFNISGYQIWSATEESKNYSFQDMSFPYVITSSSYPGETMYGLEFHCSSNPYLIYQFTERSIAINVVISGERE